MRERRFELLRARRVVVLVCQVDMDDSGTIDFHEFCMLARRRVVPQSPSPLPRHRSPTPRVRVDDSEYVPGTDCCPRASFDTRALMGGWRAQCERTAPAITTEIGIFVSIGFVQLVYRRRGR